MVMLAAAMMLLSTQQGLGQTPMPKHEVRAVWLTTIGGLDWPHSYSRSTYSAQKQQKELCAILDKLQRANINTVLLQTRIRATTIYPSALEPWDGCLSGIPGQSPGYDALKFAIDECHRRGMELHAWVVAIPIGKWNGLGCRQLRKRHPKMLRKIGDEGFMNPESTETANYLAHFCREIVDNYDVDGIHLDYIRYPETWKIRVPLSEGRMNITRIVSRICQEVKAAKPWVKMSCSPIGKHDDLPLYWSHGWNARTRVCQDPQEWLRTGLMDELFPMMYFKGEQFYPFALDWKENRHGKIVSVGLGIYLMDEKGWDRAIFDREMNVLRRNGMGHTFFRSKFFTDNIKGIYDFTCNELNLYPALAPPMTWWNKNVPTPPLRLNVKRTDNGDFLYWEGAIDNSHADYLMYNIYSSCTHPIDINDPSNLIAPRHIGDSLFVPKSNSLIEAGYAVTAMDRYGNESEPIFTQTTLSNPTTMSYWITNDGNTLALPPKGQTNDAEYVAMENQQGLMVSTRPYTDTADISQLPEGVYILKSLGRKGVTHRIGQFIIKRTWKK